MTPSGTKNYDSSPVVKFGISEIDKLSNRLLEIELELNSNIPTTLWISDLHGEGDRFKSILRGRFGMLYQTCKEALPSTVSSEKIQYLTKIIRKQAYFQDDAIQMDMQDVILCLVDVLKYKLTNIRSHDGEIFRPEFRDVISRLLSGLPVPDPIFEESIISHRLIAHLSYTIRQVLLDTSTTVIMASSVSDKQEIMACAKLGIQGYVLKPFQTRTLAATVVGYHRKAKKAQ